MKNVQELAKEIAEIKSKTADVSTNPEMKSAPGSENYEVTELYLMTEMTKAILRNMETEDMAQFLASFIGPMDGEEAETFRLWLLHNVDEHPDAAIHIGRALYRSVEPILKAYGYSS
jgi:hypothetical protein